MQIICNSNDKIEIDGTFYYRTDAKEIFDYIARIIKKEDVVIDYLGVKECTLVKYHLFATEEGAYFIIPISGYFSAHIKKNEDTGRTCYAPRDSRDKIACSLYIDFESFGIYPMFTGSIDGSPSHYHCTIFNSEGQTRMTKCSPILPNIFQSGELCMGDSNDFARGLFDQQKVNEARVPNHTKLNLYKTSFSWNYLYAQIEVKAASFMEVFARYYLNSDLCTTLSNVLIEALEQRQDPDFRIFEIPKNTILNLRDVARMVVSDNFYVKKTNKEYSFVRDGSTQDFAFEGIALEFFQRMSLPTYSYSARNLKLLADIKVFINTAFETEIETPNFLYKKTPMGDLFLLLNTVYSSIFKTERISYPKFDVSYFKRILANPSGKDKIINLSMKNHNNEIVSRTFSLGGETKGIKNIFKNTPTEISNSTINNLLNSRERAINFRDFNLELIESPLEENLLNFQIEESTNSKVPYFSLKKDSKNIGNFYSQFVEPLCKRYNLYKNKFIESIKYDENNVGHNKNKITKTADFYVSSFIDGCIFVSLKYKYYIKFVSTEYQTLNLEVIPVILSLNYLDNDYALVNCNDELFWVKIHKTIQKQISSVLSNRECYTATPVTDETLFMELFAFALNSDCCFPSEEVNLGGYFHIEKAILRYVEHIYNKLNALNLFATSPSLLGFMLTKRFNVHDEGYNVRFNITKDAISSDHLIFYSETYGHFATPYLSLYFADLNNAKISETAVTGTFPNLNNIFVNHSIDCYDFIRNCALTILRHSENVGISKLHRSTVVLARFLEEENYSNIFGLEAIPNEVWEMICSMIKNTPKAKKPNLVYLDLNKILEMEPPGHTKSVLTFELDEGYIFQDYFTEKGLSLIKEYLELGEVYFTTIRSKLFSKSLEKEDLPLVYNLLDSINKSYILGFDDNEELTNSLKLAESIPSSAYWLSCNDIVKISEAYAEGGLKGHGYFVDKIHNFDNTAYKGSYIIPRMYYSLHWNVSYTLLNYYSKITALFHIGYDRRKQLIPYLLENHEPMVFVAKNKLDSNGWIELDDDLDYIHFFDEILNYCLQKEDYEETTIKPLISLFCCAMAKEVRSYEFDSDTISYTAIVSICEDLCKKIEDASQANLHTFYVRQIFAYIICIKDITRKVLEEADMSEITHLSRKLLDFSYMIFDSLNEFIPEQIREEKKLAEILLNILKGFLTILEAASDNIVDNICSNIIFGETTEETLALTIESCLSSTFSRNNEIDWLICEDDAKLGEYFTGVSSIIQNMALVASFYKFSKLECMIKNIPKDAIDKNNYYQSYVSLSETIKRPVASRLDYYAPIARGYSIYDSLFSDSDTEKTTASILDKIVLNSICVELGLDYTYAAGKTSYFNFIRFIVDRAIENGDHDKIAWIGDLNFLQALSNTCSKTNLRKHVADTYKTIVSVVFYKIKIAYMNRLLFMSNKTVENVRTYKAVPALYSLNASGTLLPIPYSSIRWGGKYSEIDSDSLYAVKFFDSNTYEEAIPFWVMNIVNPDSANDVFYIEDEMPEDLDFDDDDMYPYTRRFKYFLVGSLFSLPDRRRSFEETDYVKSVFYKILGFLHVAYQNVAFDDYLMANFLDSYEEPREHGAEVLPFRFGSIHVPTNSRLPLLAESSEPFGYTTFVGLAQQFMGSVEANKLFDLLESRYPGLINRNQNPVRFFFTSSYRKINESREEYLDRIDILLAIVDTIVFMRKADRFLPYLLLLNHIAYMDRRCYVLSSYILRCLLDESQTIEGNEALESYVNEKLKTRWSSLLEYAHLIAKEIYGNEQHLTNNTLYGFLDYAHLNVTWSDKRGRVESKLRDPTEIIPRRFVLDFPEELSEILDADTQNEATTQNETTNTNTQNEVTNNENFVFYEVLPNGVAIQFIVPDGRPSLDPNNLPPGIYYGIMPTNNEANNTVNETNNTINETINEAIINTPAYFDAHGNVIHSPLTPTGRIVNLTADLNESIQATLEALAAEEAAVPDAIMGALQQELEPPEPEE